MSELIVSEESKQEESQSRPPLFLQHYLDEREVLFGQEVKKPPGSLPSARIIERRDNIIVVEFQAKEVVKERPRKKARYRRVWLSGWDAAMLVLLFVTAAACVASLIR